MEEKEKQASVPYFIHEGQMARMERTNRRLCYTIVAVLAVGLVMFVINNLIWMKYTSAQPKAPVEVSDNATPGQRDTAGD